MTTVYPHTARLQRCKASVPFSLALNKYIQSWYDQHKDYIVFTDTDDFDENDIEGTFRRHKLRYSETGKIHVWTGSSENTIFGDPKINHMFRAWHDCTHIVNDLGYEPLNEILVGKIQAEQLPYSWRFERDLIDAEVTGQVLYFVANNEFISDQRQFTLDYLNNKHRSILC